MSQQIPRNNVLGVGISALDLALAQDVIFKAVEEDGFHGFITVTGVHGVVEAQKSEELKRIHNRSFLSTPDGMPMVWLGKLNGFSEMDRVYGPELMLEIVEESSKRDLKHYFFGGAEGVAEKLKIKLCEKFKGVEVVGINSPPFRPMNEEEENELYQELQRLKPHFFWVGLSTPKQERFMYNFLQKYSDLTNSWGHGMVMIGVGAAFDFHTGIVRQAPYWIQRSGFEWLFRVFQDPKRLRKRYVHCISYFLPRIISQLSNIKRYETLK